MIKELIEKKTELKKSIEEYKKSRDEINMQTSILAEKRNELNKQAKPFMEDAQKYKNLRDDINAEVKKIKEIRDKINADANKISAKITAIYGNDGEEQTFKKMQLEIKKLEYIQQTAVLKPEKEKELINRITSLKREYESKKRQIETNEELKSLTIESKDIREEATKQHELLSEHVLRAQEMHDLMLKAFKDADVARKESDAAHKEFIKLQKIADSHHKQFISTQKELRLIEKELNKLKKEGATSKRKSTRADIQKDADALFKKFIAGEKLTTEQLMLIQKSKLM